jgi:Reverse transcriptase (RNA-dependent DNA polymerase)
MRQFQRKIIEGPQRNLFQAFYHNNIDLAPINKANIVMIPKKEGPQRIGDYRPISVINLFPKLLSKVLANRLTSKLPSLISINQTAFMGGRHIAENFIVTREVLQHIQRLGSPAVFMKIDFAKAFDSINWKFLMHVLQARGFPERWVAWILHMLQSSSSRIVINGRASEFFPHMTGLRQGDLISPMLFVLAVDVLQQMLLREKKS